METKNLILTGKVESKKLYDYFSTAEYDLSKNGSPFLWLQSAKSQIEKIEAILKNL
jgi:hypothetical protein